MAPRREDENAPTAPSSPLDPTTPGVPSAEAAWQASFDRWGLSSLAAPLGELIRPVAWIGAQALLVLQPTLSLFGAGPSLTRLVQRLETWDSHEEQTP